MCLICSSFVDMRQTEYWLSLARINQAGGLYGRILFEAGHLLTFTAFRMDANSRLDAYSNKYGN